MEIHPEAAARFDQLGIDLLTRFRPAGRARTAGRFSPDIYPAASFSSDDLIGPIKWKSAIVNGEGEEVGRVIEELNLSIEGSEYQELKKLVFAIHRTKAVARVASFEYLLDQVWEWVESSIKHGVRVGLAEFIKEGLEKDVREWELWFPLHRVYSEIPLTIGSVKFRTVDKALMERWQESIMAKVPPEQKDNVHRHYSRLRSEIQGSLAAIVRVTGESRKAREDARKSAQMAVSMLRFIAPANFSPRIRSYCTLLGEEGIPRSFLLRVENGDQAFEEQGVAETGNFAWVIAQQDLALLPSPLLNLLNQISSERKTAYAQQLYDSLLIYSRSSIAKDTSDKLVFILVALETMLLRDESEPIQKNVGERMAQIAGTTIEQRRSIVANLTQVYSIRSKFVHHGQTAADDEPLYPFMVNAWTCFCNLLGWQSRFSSKDDLISWLETRKLSG